MATVTCHTDILSATDLPGIDPALDEYFATMMGVEGQKLRGVPIETTSTVVALEHPTGRMQMIIENKVLEIHTDTIPADAFDAPKDYKLKTMSEVW